jgi:cytochrome c oxidase cbb3-type subunit 1
MTFAPPIPDVPAPAASDPRAIDRSARWALLLLLASGLVWLAVGGVLALVHSIQLHTPGFLAASEWFTFGRTQAAAETALVYGWAANAGFAVALWLLGRLGGTPLRGLGLVKIGGAFWNLGVTLGVIGILGGDLTSFSLLQTPAYVQPLLLVAFAAIGTAGVLAWSGRRVGRTFAAQWYAVAALFAFPWVYSVAQAMLFALPVRGTMQAVVAVWAGQNVLSLWLGPLALAAAYYLVPKITGRTLAAYDLAAWGFGVLLFIGPWTGGRHLVGGPVPAWVPTVGIACSLLLLFHFIVVAINLRDVFGNPTGSTALRFMALGVAAYVLGGLIDAGTALRGAAKLVQFTYFAEAQTMLAILGGFTLPVFGAIYFLTPRVTGKTWGSDGLIKLHLGAAGLGLVLLVGGLAGAGLKQGLGLNDAGTAFAVIFDSVRPWLLVATAGVGLQLLGGVFLAVNLALQLQPESGGAAVANQPSAEPAP